MDPPPQVLIFFWNLLNCFFSSQYSLSAPVWQTTFNLSVLFLWYVQPFKNRECYHPFLSFLMLVLSQMSDFIDIKWEEVGWMHRDECKTSQKKVTTEFFFSIIIMYIVRINICRNENKRRRKKNIWKLFSIFAKTSMLDIWQGSEYASVF